MTATAHAIVQKIVSNLKSQPIVRAWLFGSYARGEEVASCVISSSKITQYLAEF